MKMHPKPLVAVVLVVAAALIGTAAASQSSASDGDDGQRSDASYGSVLLRLFEEDGLRMGQLAGRARLSKQAMTELVRRLERDGLVERRPDPHDGRASLIFLTARSRAFEPVAARVLRELDGLVRRELPHAQVVELKAGLQQLLGLGG